MKKIFLFTAILAVSFITTNVIAQDKSQRPSPPAKVSQTLASGANISIDYSQPALKGRVIGTNVEPMKDKVWRMGANEATVFETDKDVMVEGKKLEAGKYSMFGKWTDQGFVIIFNKNWKIWGTTYEQNKDADVLSVIVKPGTNTVSAEKLLYLIDKSGKVSLLWGTMQIDFTVK
jgi:hypothetical protein